VNKKDGVGYDDVYPITSTGRFLASLVAILGIVFFAPRASILGSRFVEQPQKQRSQMYCPHCGQEIKEEESNGF
jgi:hypothetical protein